MIILTPNNSTKAFKAITRLQVCGSPAATPGKLIVVDQDKNISYEIATSNYTHSYNCTSGYFETFSAITFPNDSSGNFILREGTFYTLRIRNSGDTQDIYRDIIFCTDQSISDYSIQTIGNDPSEKAYKEHETNNEYIVL